MQYHSRRYALCLYAGVYIYIVGIHMCSNGGLISALCLYGCVYIYTCIYIHVYIYIYIRITILIWKCDIITHSLMCRYDDIHPSTPAHPLQCANMTHMRYTHVQQHLGRAYAGDTRLVDVDH